MTDDLQTRLARRVDILRRHYPLQFLAADDIEAAAARIDELEAEIERLNAALHEAVKRLPPGVPYDD